MPGYRTHLSVSSAVGTALSAGSWFFGGVSLPSAMMAGSLCAVGGLVPDIDSKTSESFRKCLAIVAGFSSLLLVSRLRDFSLDAESVAMIGGGNFVLIWFFIGGLIKKTTVHRGMCHSVPMAVIAGDIIFLLSSGPAATRLFNAFAIFLGVMIHLTLDEFYSFEVDKSNLLPGVNVKKSFGSAIKLIDFDHRFSTAFFYTILFVLTNIAINEPVWTEGVAADSSAAASQEELRGKRDIELIQKKYSHLYDLSVLEWVADNDLLLKPAAANNPKWAELERLLNISSDTETKTARTSKSAVSGSQLLQLLGGQKSGE